jgi:hypothetical protein
MSDLSERRKSNAFARLLVDAYKDQDGCHLSRPSEVCDTACLEAIVKLSQDIIRNKRRAVPEITDKECVIHAENAHGKPTRMKLRRWLNAELDKLLYERGHRDHWGDKCYCKDYAIEIILAYAIPKECVEITWGDAHEQYLECFEYSSLSSCMTGESSPTSCYDTPAVGIGRIRSGAGHARCLLWDTDQGDQLHGCFYNTSAAAAGALTLALKREGIISSSEVGGFQSITLQSQDGRWPYIDDMQYAYPLTIYRRTGYMRDAILTLGGGPEPIRGHAVILDSTSSDYDLGAYPCDGWCEQCDYYDDEYTNAAFKTFETEDGGEMALCKECIAEAPEHGYTVSGYKITKKEDA